MRKQKKLVGKITRYLPVLIILLSITIIVGSTFAYFTDSKDEVSELTFSKVELSSETTTGINGTLRDVIPGTKLVDGALEFSKSIDSEPIYVRAKISFSLPTQYKEDEDMIALLDALRSATDFNIKSEEQHDAVWSAKDGNYYYLLNADDTSKLMKVDTIDTYILSNEVVVPRDLENLEDNAQYMKGINFHIAFEAIQADNVSDVLADTKETFNAIFPANENERVYTVVLNVDGNVLEQMILSYGSIIQSPTIEKEGLLFDGWYTLDGRQTGEWGEEIIFPLTINSNFNIYAKFRERASEGLEFTDIIENGEVVAYSVALGECEDSKIILPTMHLNKPVTEITSSGFRDSDIESITLHEGITKIGDYAFTYCRNLKGVSFPDSLLEIGGNAFYSCSNIVEVILPNNIEIIGDSAFYNCNATTLTIPENVKKICSRAFYNFNNLTSINYNTINMTLNQSSNFTDIFYRAGSNSYGITLNIGNKVEQIPNNLFRAGSADNSPDIIKINFEDESVCTTIGNYAFAYCASLIELDFPLSLTTINQYAFTECSGVKLITVPKNLKTIGTNAFSNCTNVLEVYNNSSLNIVRGTNTLGYIARDAKNVARYSSDSKIKIDENGYKFYYDGTEANNYLIDYVGVETELVLPENFRSLNYKIYQNAFTYSEGIKSVVIPDSVTTIGKYAFKGCNQLETITLGSGITSLGEYAFHKCFNINKIYYNCINLTTANVNSFYNSGRDGKGITLVIGAQLTQYNSPLFCYTTSTYTNAAKLIAVRFEENSLCTSITGGFEYCKYLRSVTIPKNVTSIGTYVFKNCEKLIEVINLSSLTMTLRSSLHGYVAQNALYINTQETSCIIEDENGCEFFYAGEGKTYLLKYNGDGTDVVLPDNYNGYAYGIYESAFSGSNIVSLTLPENILSIGTNAFTSCTNLETINYNITELNSFSAGAFTACGINSDGIVVNVGANVKTIPGSLFAPNSTGNEANIVKVEFLGENCESIGPKAFYNCINLKEINLPNSVTSIGANAFYGCTSLTNLTLSNSLVSIGAYAFNNCVGLSSLHLGKDVTTIDGNPFRGCKDLVLTVDTLNSNFKMVNNCLVTNDDVLIAGFNTSVIPNNIKTINSYAFDSCDKLTTITLPETLEKINNYAFYNCTALTRINYNAIAVTNLASSNNVFYKAGANGSGIKVVIGAEVTSIPSYLFSPYTTTATAPKILIVEFEENSICKSIGTYAFRQCTNLLSIQLPDSITSIGANAFQTTGSAYILCANDSIVSLANGKGNSNIYYVDASIDFRLIEFTEIPNGGDVNGTYSDGTDTWVRVGTEGSYTYYKKYTA